MVDLCGCHSQVKGFVPCVVLPANVDFSTHEEQLLCAVLITFLLQVVSADDSEGVCLFSRVSVCHCVVWYRYCRLLVAS